MIVRRSFHVILFSCLVLSLFLSAGRPRADRADVEGILKGKINLYLYKSGTGDEEGGVNDFHVSIGDTISIDVFLRNPRQEKVTGINVFLTVDDEYFDVVSFGKNKDGSFMPFIQGTFMKPGKGALIETVGNSSHGDSLTAMDNGLDGWQLDYMELSGVPDEYGVRPFSAAPYGVAATFKLVAKAPCDSVTISLDREQFYNRESRYQIPGSNDTYSFKVFKTCYITVSGVEIEPPLPDVVMAPGGTDSSIDLDDHIGVSSVPDSLIVWEVSGNKEINVVVDPDTRVVTFSAPVAFKGYEDVVFTVRHRDYGVSNSDTVRVTVDSPPSFTAAVPDTVYIHEDSLEVAFWLRDVVTDPDDDFEDLSIRVTPGENLMESIVNDTLYVKGSENFFGEDSIGISVMDGSALGDSLTVPVVVLPVNDPPVLAGLPDVTFERNDDYRFDISGYAYDVDGDELELSWSSPENLKIDALKMMVLLEALPEFTGTEEVVFTVEDPYGLAASDTMRVTVTPAAKPPVWTRIPKVGFAQGGADSSIVLWDYVADPDDPDSLLTFEVKNRDDLDFWEINPRNGRLYLYDLDNSPGYDRLTVSAFDPDGNYSATYINVFIAPADGTPIVGGIPDTTIVAGTRTEWIDLDDYYYDIDNADYEMKWTWGRMAGADSSATVFIDPASHLVRLSSIGEGIFGKDKIFFTVTDPSGKFGDDICDVTVVEDLTRPILQLPPKVGFIAGEKDSLDLDDYVNDPEYEKSELVWSWTGNRNVVVAYQKPDEFRTRPVSFSGPEDWTGWERVVFDAANPLGGTASDTLTVFSVPADGTPVAGGLSEITLKAGECIYVDLDDYYWDADHPDYAVTWSVSGNDSVSVTIEPTTHLAHICALSETWQGKELLTFTVTDPDGNSAAMDVAVSVTDAVLRSVLSVRIFRNPMQEDYMDFFVSSRVKLAGAPSLTVEVEGDSTGVSTVQVTENYYTGRYLLPLDASLGVKGTAEVVMKANTADGRAVQDTARFAYGRIGAEGGKIAVGAVTLSIPGGALEKAEFVTVIPGGDTRAGRPKSLPGEITLCGPVYDIGPPSLRSVKPMSLEIRLRGEREGAGVYRDGRDGWSFVGAGGEGAAVGAPIYSGGTYRLGYDRVPPRVKRLEPGNGVLRFSLVDYGSGIDEDSIEMVFDGLEAGWMFDPGASVVSVSPKGVDLAGSAGLTVLVRDRSGNESVERFQLDESVFPCPLYVEQNTPNPFNPVTHISFVLGSDTRVRVEIFDLLGRRVRVLADRLYPRGRHTVSWNAEDEEGRVVSSGIYIYRVIAADRSVSRKMMFLE